MFLSVIVPVHNVAKYLSECIESILRQDFENYELIIVENASTDKSYDICKYYEQKHEKIKLIHSDIASLCNARNLGLHESKGEYIWFVDGDDTVLDEAFSIIYGLIRSVDAPDILIFDSSSKNIEKSKKEIPLRSLSKDEQLYGCFDANKWSGFVWNKIYRKDFICDSEFSAKGVIEDLLYNVKIILNETKQACVMYSPVGLYNYRLISNSASHCVSDRSINTFSDYDTLLELVKPLPQYDKLNAIIAQARVNLARSILEGGYKTNKKLYCTVKSKCRKEIFQNIEYMQSFTGKCGAICSVFCPRLINLLRTLIKKGDK